MKKFIILFTTLFFVPASSSDLYVYNNSSYHLFYMLGVKPISWWTHPFLYSRGNYPEPYGTNLYFAYLAPTDNTVYSNSGGFPFDATSVSPVSAQITHWVRQLTPSSSWVNTTNSLAQTLFGTTHRFCAFKFYITDGEDVITSGDIDPIDLDEPLEQDIGDDMLGTYFPLDGDVFILID